MARLTWTNSSVKTFAGNDDPVRKISDETRSLVLKAMDDGWQGPPFDPFWLAEYLGYSTVPHDDVLDSLVRSRPSGGVEIEYNPNQSRSRIRFSLAHEIAHTLFPDFAQTVRNRSTHGAGADGWQLELLCNIAAAEILMPTGLSLDFGSIPVTIDNVVQLRRKFDVSIEALLLRIVKLTSQPVTVFVATRVEDIRNAPYRIDYSVGSMTSRVKLQPGLRLPAETILAECTAVGYTAKGKESWSTELTELEVECVGIPPYADRSYPRVMGIVRTKGKAEPRLTIKYLIGDAREPRGNGNRIVAHIVNDKTPNWGRGFALAVAKKWPDVYKDFQNWAATSKTNLVLGKSHLSPASDDLSLFHMVAQHGYGLSPKPRIRYSVLRECLSVLAKAAAERHATVHMPRIGTGYAGGNWSVIKELLDETLIHQGIEVTVYDLAGREIRPKQDLLEFGVSE